MQKARRTRANVIDSDDEDAQDQAIEESRQVFGFTCDFLVKEAGG